MRELGATYAYQSSPGVGGSIGTGGGPFTVGKVEAGSIFGSVVGSALNLFVMGGNTYNFIHALKQQGALRQLAEPNLIAMDGQQASFLAGGEFPVPMVQNNGERASVVIVFKEYGIKLNFKPTIIDEDHIRLELEPEVSTIDFANGVKFDGFLIPALRTRKAKTGVELRDGQSFALAGLLDNSESQTLSKIPGIGDIPILGNLFKSKQFQKNETELMFIVTANMVKPVNRDDLPQMPNVENLKSGSPLGIGEKTDEVDGKTGFSVGSSAPAGTDAKPAEVKPGATTPAPAAAAPAGAQKTALVPGSISETKDGAPAAAPANQTAKASPNQ